MNSAAEANKKYTTALAEIKRPNENILKLKIPLTKDQDQVKLMSK